MSFSCRISASRSDTGIKQGNYLLAAVEMKGQEGTVEEHKAPGQEPNQTKDTVSQLLSR